MSAAEKERIENIACLGIIAGAGTLPLRLVESCEGKGLKTFIVGFEGQTDPMLVKGRDHLWTRLGASAKVLKALKEHNIKDLVLIGSIRRPSLGDMIPDWRTLDFYRKVGLKALGDNDLLSAIRSLLEEEGFRIHGVHKFAENLLAQQGALGASEPQTEDWIDIKRGIEVAQALGALDAGQSVIVQEGMVLGVEAAEGTDELIRRCKPLKRKGRGGVLVKLCKPQQDRDLDLPTIGPETVRLAVDAGLAGIAIHAGESLVLDAEEVAQIANKHKMFVIGINPLTA